MLLSEGVEEVRGTLGGPQALLMSRDIDGVSSSPHPRSLLCTKPCPWHRRYVNAAQALLRSSPSTEETAGSSNQCAWCSSRGHPSFHTPREDPSSPRGSSKASKHLRSHSHSVNQYCSVNPILASFVGLPSGGPLSSDWPQGSGLPSSHPPSLVSHSPLSLERDLYTICRICDHDLQNNPRLSHRLRLLHSLSRAQASLLPPGLLP